MKTIWILCTATVAAGHFLIAGAVAAPLGLLDTGAPGRSDLVRVQVESGDRMSRMRQHRSILQSALQPPRQTAAAEPPKPQARALQRPEPVVTTVPQAEAVPQEAADEGQGLVTCEAAEQIVADFGFSDIGSPDCSGDLYRFSAMRDGTAYEIGISAATGEIAEVSRQ